MTGYRMGVIQYESCSVRTSLVIKERIKTYWQQKQITGIGRNYDKVRNSVWMMISYNDAVRTFSSTLSAQVSKLSYNEFSYTEYLTTCNELKCLSASFPQSTWFDEDKDLARNESKPAHDGYLSAAKVDVMRPVSTVQCPSHEQDASKHHVLCKLGQLWYPYYPIIIYHFVLLVY